MRWRWDFVSEMMARQMLMQRPVPPFCSLSLSHSRGSCFVFMYHDQLFVLSRPKVCPGCQDTIPA